MNIASNGNLAPESASAVSQDSDSTAGDPSESDTSAEEQRTEEVKPIGCSVDNERSDEPFSYVGSSSGIYLLSRLFPKDGTHLHPKASETLPRPLEGHEDDLMIARFNGGDRLNKLGFSKNLDADWKLPPKELTDYLIDM